MAKKEELKTPEKTQPQPAKFVRQYFMVFLNRKTKPIQISLEQVQFIEAFAGFETNDLLQKEWFINKVKFIIDVKDVKEVAPPLEKV